MGSSPTGYACLFATFFFPNFVLYYFSSFPILPSFIFFIHNSLSLQSLQLNPTQQSKAKLFVQSDQTPNTEREREREREKQSKMESGFEEKDFLACCGSTKFAQEMALASPFASLEQAVAAATDIWFNKVDVSAWLQAFSAHPQIGDSAPSSQSHHQTTSAQLSFFLSIF